MIKYSVCPNGLRFYHPIPGKIFWCEGQFWDVTQKRGSDGDDGQNLLLVRRKERMMLEMKEKVGGISNPNPKKTKKYILEDMHKKRDAIFVLCCAVQLAFDTCGALFALLVMMSLNWMNLPLAPCSTSRSFTHLSSPSPEISNHRLVHSALISHDHCRSSFAFHWILNSDAFRNLVGSVSFNCSVLVHDNCTSCTRISTKYNPDHRSYDRNDSPSSTYHWLAIASISSPNAFPISSVALSISSFDLSASFLHPSMLDFAFFLTGCITFCPLLKYQRSTLKMNSF